MKLSKRQLDVLTLLVMAGKNGASAYHLGAGLNTLQALGKRGLAEFRSSAGDLFFPRMRSYVVTKLGHRVIRDEIERKESVVCG